MAVEGAVDAAPGIPAVPGRRTNKPGQDRPSWQEFKDEFCKVAMPDVGDAKAHARKLVRKAQHQRAAQHVAQHLQAGEKVNKHGTLNRDGEPE
jgi:hypothetical protein